MADDTQGERSAKSLKLPGGLSANAALPKLCRPVIGPHRAAAHDPRHAGVQMAVGHCYSLDPRGHQPHHLTVGEGLHEHDLTMLKRLKPSGNHPSNQ